MLVDDKLAKEKLIREIHRINSNSLNNFALSGNQVAQLIRNTDLTDCQPQDEPMNEAAADTRTPDQRRIAHLEHEIEMLTNAGVIECAVRNKSVAEYMAHWEGRALKAEGLISPAPDQGSVRNATDMRERCARVCEEIATRSSLGTLREQNTAAHCAAAIRALPDQKD